MKLENMTYRKSKATAALLPNGIPVTHGLPLPLPSYRVPSAAGRLHRERDFTVGELIRVLALAGFGALVLVLWHTRFGFKWSFKKH